MSKGRESYLSRLAYSKICYVRKEINLCKYQKVNYEAQVKKILTSIISNDEHLWYGVKHIDTGSGDKHDWTMN